MLTLHTGPSNPLVRERDARLASEERNVLRERLRRIRLAVLSADPNDPADLLHTFALIAREVEP